MAVKTNLHFLYNAPKEGMIQWNGNANFFIYLIVERKAGKKNIVGSMAKTI